MAKIAFVTTNKSAWGGSEYLWYQTALKLVEEGNNVIAGIPRWKNIPAEIGKLGAKGIEVHYTTDLSSAKKLFNRFVPSGMQVSYKDDGYRFLKSFAPDLTVINQGGNWGGVDLMDYCMRNGLKYVTISQAANECKWPDDRTSELLSAGLKNSLMNYYVSRANIRLTELQSAGEVRNSKVIFNPFNVDPSKVQSYPDVKENYYLANVARHEIYAKGHDILFQVFEQRKWKERNLTVRLYGKGEQSGSIRRLIEHFRLNNVTIEGHVSPEDIWNSNHALILSSRYEGLPLALVEAMLCSRTSVVTSVSGNPEVIEDNTTGFLAGSASAESLDEAMERAWERRSEWENIGKEAGLAIRRIVPEDPIEHFSTELRSLDIF